MPSRAGLTDPDASRGHFVIGGGNNALVLRGIGQGAGRPDRSALASFAITACRGMATGMCVGNRVIWNLAERLCDMASCRNVYAHIFGYVPRSA